MIGVHRSKKGQASLEMLYVFPLLFMIFVFVAEVGFLMYDWAVINYQVSTAAVRAATTGQFTDSVRLSLCQNIHDWTVNGRDYTYSANGTAPPGTADSDTVYVYGSDRSTPIQRGQNIYVNVDYPWRFKFFILDGLMSWAVDQKSLRLHFNAAFPSEVFFE